MQNGNVLFIILIAVALFAALAYAVTQSTRSGGNDVAQETTAVNVAQVLSVPPAYRTAAQRMMVSKGIDGGEIVFTDPSAFGAAPADVNERNVYHPTGGDMPYPTVPKELVEDVATSGWAVNSENEVVDVGRNGSSPPEIYSVELIAFLHDVKQSVCEAINAKFAISGMPTVAGVDYNYIQSSTSYMDNGGAGIIGGGAGDAALIGKTEGCFLTGGKYVFYSVLIER